MEAWSKEKALRELKKLAEQADYLHNSRPFQSEHMRWLTNCLQILEEIFGPASRYYLLFKDLRFAESSQYTLPVDIYLEYCKDLSKAKGILLGAKDYLKRKEIGEIYSARDSKYETSLIIRILHLIENQLRKAIRETPNSEKIVQNAFENLLIGADIEYSRESDSIKYSSKTYTPDFSIGKIELAIEIKLCKRSAREKEIIAEINDDILAYQTKYKNLFFIVYDIGCIRDIELFCGSFEEFQNVRVRVIKH